MERKREFAATRTTSKAVDKLVAQISNLLYRSASSLRPANSNPPIDFGRAADWKSAIQQVLETCATFSPLAGYSALGDFANATLHNTTIAGVAGLLKSKNSAA